MGEKSTSILGYVKPAIIRAAMSKTVDGLVDARFVFKQRDWFD